jgi:hypothetical protein
MFSVSDAVYGEWKSSRFLDSGVLYRPDNNDV